MGRSDAITLFLCGDVMIGRGIDQILPHPNEPRLYESYVRDARRYVAIAEEANGPIPHPVGFEYVWGDALAELERVGPACRIVNLETAVTAGGEPWPGKGIHYRVHPENARCLIAAGVDCCSLANNHALDWGPVGLAETLDTLARLGVRAAGAGCDRAQAMAPAALEAGAGRVLVFGMGAQTSGIPGSWAATDEHAGLNLLPDLSPETAEEVGRQVRAVKGAGDIAVASIHWGGNWGYGIPQGQRAFAHALIDAGGVDVVHGHSSHHVKGVEVYAGKLILYGCGDFLNDYEGIEGYEDFRDDLALMYFPAVDVASGALIDLSMTPTQTRRLRVNRAAPEDAHWLQGVLAREGAALGTGATLERDGTLRLRWA